MVRVARISWCEAWRTFIVDVFSVQLNVRRMSVHEVVSGITAGALREDSKGNTRLKGGGRGGAITPLRLPVRVRWSYEYCSKGIELPAARTKYHYSSK